MFHFSVSRRLLLLGVGALVALALTAGLLVINKRSQMLQDRRSATQHVVQVAQGVLEEFSKLETSGVMTREEAQTRAKEAVRAIRYEKTEYLWIHTLDTTQMVMHPTKPELDGKSLLENKDPTGKKLFVEMNAVVKQSGAGFVEYSWPKPGSESPVPKISYVSGFAPWNWVIGSGIYVDDVSSAFWADVRTALVWLGALSAALFAGFWFVRRSIISALDEAQRVAERIASGDLATTVPVREAHDELDALLNSLSRMQTQLQSMVATIRHGSDVMLGAMGQVVGGNAEVERSAQQQVARLEETASTIEELSATVKTNAQTAQLVDTRARETATLASTGGEAMRSVAAAMATARANSKRIGDVTELIDEISFQTNLLALNASVESARAGEHGRGFAVVAAEVRQLALKSAASAKEIKQLVRETNQSIIESATASEEAGAVVAKVVVAAEGLASLVSDITRATQEQSQALAQASSAVSDIDRANQQNVSAVGRTAEAARGLSSEAQHLVDAVAQFHLAEGFVALPSAEAQPSGFA
jgi:methyl-accepting chemotaxis protein